MPEQNAPHWFTQALQHPAREHAVSSAGVQLRYRSWNADDRSKPPLVLVHGHRGHARWWDFTAPMLTAWHRVYALDLTGMGDSDHRTEYTADHHCNDIAAVIRAAGGGAATVIGHSYGGIRLLRLCRDQPDLVRHAILVDSKVTVFDDDPVSAFPTVGRPTPYPDYATARSRFVLMPNQTALTYALEHVAHHSLKRADGGWTWKADRRLPAILEADGAALLQQIRVPVDYIYGQNSALVSRARAQRIVELLRRSRPAIEVPQAGHHLMLDQPLALVVALRTLLAAGP